MKIEKYSVMAAAVIICFCLTPLVSAHQPEREELSPKWVRFSLCSEEKAFTPSIHAIHNEMQQMIATKETDNEPENDIRAREEPANDETRQGETPEVQPRGEALPP